MWKNSFQSNRIRRLLPREKRFAYSLYLDMLVLLIKLSREVERRRGEYPLAGTRFISRLLMDERVKSLMTRYSSEPFPSMESWRGWLGR